MAVTETIQEILQGIDDAQYGRDMRQFIHKGIQKCYEEGSAGETDLVARQAIEEIQDDLTALNEWYELPCTVGSSASGASAWNARHILINPALKLMDVNFIVGLSGTSYSGGFGTIFKELPIIQFYSNGTQAGDAERFSEKLIPLQVYSGSPTMSGLTCEIYNTDNNLDDMVKPSDATQSMIRMWGAFPDNAAVRGHLLLPYKELCSAHPFSEATLITT